MLASSRQDFHQPFHRQPHTSSRSPLQQPLSFDPLSQPHPALYDQKLLQQYLESQRPYSQPTVVDEDFSSGPNPFMTEAYDFANPAIRIQQSTPTPQLPSTFAHTSMVPAQVATSWNSYPNDAQTDAQSLQTPRSSRTHHRASSSSSVGSNGSQYQAAGPANGYTAFSNHLPTPSHTPTQESFLNSNNFNNTNSFTPTSSSGMDSTMNAHFSMKQALMDQNVPEDDVPGFAHSARHSVSSYGHDSPATPHTTHGEDFEDGFKIPSNEMRQQAVMVPKFERTYTDAALDTLYNPTSAMPAQPQQIQTLAQSNAANAAANGSLLSPYRPNNIVQRTLQAAHQARSQSPSSSVSRGVSPFRHNSPFRQVSAGYSSPRVRVGTAAEAREQKLEADALHAMKQNLPSSEEAQPKTISPKDALLEYREADEDSKVPLFPESGASEYGNQYSGGDQYSNATQSNYDTTTSGQPYRRDSWTTPQFTSNFSTSSTASQPAAFSFAPPAISGNLHGLPFGATSQYRSTSNNNNNSMTSAPEPLPDFPAHLTSMESSASEAEPQHSQEAQKSQAGTEHLNKPASSAADTGTYTCTYHGCTLRFETPQKLQKHKREGHRNPNPTSMGSNMTSAALLERNSQAGPHKCERINPTTGKPCNTIFSRPYDLTRHEDTIHNARKQKVRCALCVEEKTFSRNDALTRHMRVVHPEVDFPGKHRRRGGNHD